MSYLFIGDGRLARHMGHYLNSLGQKVSVWSRRSTVDLNPLVQKADVICISTRDQEIQSVIKAYKLDECGKPLVHFSGSQSIEGTYGFHPLMSFGPELYELTAYKETPFVGTQRADAFKNLFPKLKNNYYQIESSKLALYHTYCSMTGNFPQILWAEISRNLESEVGLPAEVLRPYIKQISNNYLSSGEKAITGPLVRNDSRTLVRHLDALTGNRLQGIYFSFVNLFQKKHKMEKPHESRGLSTTEI